MRKKTTMILRKILTLSLIATNLLIKINPVFSNTNYPIWEEEDAWITVIRSNQEVMKIKKGSIQQEGKYKKLIFATFAREFDSNVSEYVGDKYLRSIGEGYFSCQKNNNNLNDNLIFSPANVNNTYFKNLKIFQTKEDWESGNAYLANNEGWGYLTGRINAIHHYVCQDINPSYLKVGMSMFNVKKLLYNGGFKIVELPDLAHTINSNLCDTQKPCIDYTMNGIGHIIFHNKKTGVYLRISAIDNVLYSVENTMNKLGY